VPDQRLDGFELAEVERPLAARHLVCIPPVLQQPQRDGRVPGQPSSRHWRTRSRMVSTSGMGTCRRVFSRVSMIS
jgi:hypothetical protein